MTQASSTTRRQFLAIGSAAVAATVVAPSVATASKTDSRTIIGEGDYSYKVLHDWPQLPKKYTWQTTHNVALDAAENLYVIHGRKTAPRKTSSSMAKVVRSPR